MLHFSNRIFAGSGLSIVKELQGAKIINAFAYIRSVCHIIGQLLQEAMRRASRSCNVRGAVSLKTSLHHSHYPQEPSETNPSRS